MAITFICLVASQLLGWIIARIWNDRFRWLLLRSVLDRETWLTMAVILACFTVVMPAT